MRKNIVFLTLVAGFAIVSPAHAQETKTYSTGFYSISYPGNWRLDTTRQTVAAIMFFSPLDNAQDKFDENVNILTQDLHGQNIDLNAYKKISEGQLGQMGPGAKMLHSAIEKLPGGDRYAFECLMTMNGNALHVRSVCRIKNETAYLVSFTAKTDTYTRYLAAGKGMLDSFRFN